MSRTPEPWKTLPSELRKMKEDIRRLQNRSAFALSGIKPTAEDEMTAYGNFIVTGDFTAEGKIYNDALVNPVKPDVTSDFATGWAASTSYAVKMSRTWAVPAGFTVAQINGSAKAIAYNNSGAPDYLYVRSKIVRVSDGAVSYGYGTPMGAQANTYVTNIGLAGAYIGVSGGDSLRLEVEVRTEVGAWPAFAGNVAEWTGAISWYRL